ncbi:MAG: lamin tail domain-containing protein [Pirellulales bacterium]|nr:lamin tail domain-containing protein [Pirellulales bacterium]
MFGKRLCGARVGRPRKAAGRRLRLEPLEPRQMLSAAAAVDEPGGDAAGIGDLQNYLRVTEINYHPSAPTEDEIALGFNDKNLFEFIELTNVGATTIDVSVADFTTGIWFDFAVGSISSLAPGQRVVVVANRDAFAARYGTAALARVTGVFINDPNDGTVGFDPLANSGELLKLIDQHGITVQKFEYDDSGDWPSRADGWGSTLEIIDANGDVTDGKNWRSSGQYAGSPGGAGLARVEGLVINEVLTHTDPPDVDAIEILNTTGQPIDISGWYLSDVGTTEGSYLMYRIPAGTIVPAGGYHVFDEYDFNWSAGADPDDFALNGAHGDHVWLWTSAAEGKLERFAAHVEFQAAANGESFGAWPNATGDLYPMKSVTLGEANSGPRVGPVILSEVHYNPGDMANVDQLEFIEIYNPTPAAIDLTEWRIRRGVDFDFPAGTSLGAFSTLLVVPFNPTTDMAARNAFKSHYGLATLPAMVGPYTGKLADGGEAVQLQRPDEPPLEEPDYYPRLLEDEIDYNDKAPWPTAADGGGSSLHRASLGAWGHDPAGWTAAAPTPGTAPFAAVGGTLDVIVRDDDDPLAGDDRGEASALPTGRAWLDEWDAFWVEFWGASANSNTVDVTGFSLDLRYNTTVFSALEIQFGPAFTLDQDGLIRDEFGRIDHLSGRTSLDGIGDDKFVLLARVRFGPTDADAGLPVDAIGGYVSPSDALALEVLGGQVQLDSIGWTTAQTTVPDVPVWPVMYDLDDDDWVTLADLSFFVVDYTHWVGEPGAPRAAASDFDHSGNVNLGDLSYFVVNYLRSRGQGDVNYSERFPAFWQPPAEAAEAASALAGLSDAAQSDSPGDASVDVPDVGGSNGTDGDVRGPVVTRGTRHRRVTAVLDPDAVRAAAWAQGPTSARAVARAKVLRAVDRLVEIETRWSP